MTIYFLAIAAGVGTGAMPPIIGITPGEAAAISKAIDCSAISYTVFPKAGVTVSALVEILAKTINTVAAHTAINSATQSIARK